MTDPLRRRLTLLRLDQVVTLYASMKRIACARSAAARQDEVAQDDTLPRARHPKSACRFDTVTIELPCLIDGTRELTVALLESLRNGICQSARHLLFALRTRSAVRSLQGQARQPATADLFIIIVTKKKRTIESCAVTKKGRVGGLRLHVVKCRRDFPGITELSSPDFRQSRLKIYQISGR